MAAYKEFESNKLKIRYFPDEKVVMLLPQKGIAGHQMNLIKNKLETFLPIDSVKQESGGISLKLSSNLLFQPEELFRSFGFEGGMDATDASDVALQGAKNDLEQEKKNAPPTPPNGPISQPGAGNGPPGAPPPLDPEQQNESLLISLFEAGFWKPFKRRPKQFHRHSAHGKVNTGKRSGKYWAVLERALGKNKEKITQKDILHLRKKFGMQPFSESRNKSLRDLDRAYRYFLGKIKREKGEDSKAAYKREYDSQANLKPSDYITGKHEKRLDNDTFGEQDEQESANEGQNSPGMSLKDMDLDLDKGEPGLGWDDVQVEDSESVPEL